MLEGKAWGEHLCSNKEKEVDEEVGDPLVASACENGRVKQQQQEQLQCDSVGAIGEYVYNE